MCYFHLLDDYMKHRMSVGVAEGSEEVPATKCLPLEYNLDLGNGGKVDYMLVWTAKLVQGMQANYFLRIARHPRI